jgi:hypothetical protein
MANNSGISYQGSGSFVSDRGAAGIEEVVYAADEAGSLGRVGQAHLVDQLHDHQLQNVAEILDLENKKKLLIK